MSKVREILRSYYFTNWKDEDECVNTILSELKKALPKKKKLNSWDTITDILADVRNPDDFEQGYNQAISDMEELFK